MPMDGRLLAIEAIAKMGGAQTPERMKAFVDFCTAIVEHIQTNAVVNGGAVSSGGGPITGAKVT